jgi:hypothetical protein
VSANDGAGNSISSLDLSVEMDPRIAAAFFIATLAHHKDRKEFDLFFQAMGVCLSTGKRPRNLVRSISRTTKIIFEQRQTAALVARQLVAAMMLRGFSIAGQPNIFLNFSEATSIRGAFNHLTRTLPKYKQWPNFHQDAWVPSVPVLHLAIGFINHAKDTDIVSLIGRPDWVFKAARDAQTSAALLEKCLDQPAFVQVMLDGRNRNAEIIAQLPSQIGYKKHDGDGNAEWKALGE